MPAPHWGCPSLAFNVAQALLPAMNVGQAILPGLEMMRCVLIAYSSSRWRSALTGAPGGVPAFPRSASGFRLEGGREGAFIGKTAFPGDFLIDSTGFHQVFPDAVKAGYAGHWGMEFLPQGDVFAELAQARALFLKYAG